MHILPILKAVGKFWWAVLGGLGTIFGVSILQLATGTSMPTVFIGASLITGGALGILLVAPFTKSLGMSSTEPSSRLVASRLTARVIDFQGQELTASECLLMVGRDIAKGKRVDTPGISEMRNSIMAQLGRGAERTPDSWSEASAPVAKFIEELWVQGLLRQETEEPYDLGMDGQRYYRPKLDVVYLNEKGLDVLNFLETA